MFSPNFERLESKLGSNVLLRMHASDTCDTCYKPLCNVKLIAQLSRYVVVTVPKKELLETPSYDEKSTTPLVLLRMGVDGFNLSESHCFLGSQGASNDELLQYLHSNTTEAEQMLLHSDAGIVAYWVNKINMFSGLSKIALEILTLPASSSSSEQDFSGFKNNTFKP